jgi:hypothetical protein
MLRSRFCLACLLLLIVAICPMVIADDTPQLHKHDFGTVDEGRSVRHSFSIRNLTSKSLDEIVCKVSCSSCIHPVVVPEQILSGAVGEVVLELRTEGKHGHLSQSAVIMAGRPSRPPLRQNLWVMVGSGRSPSV